VVVPALWTTTRSTTSVVVAAVDVPQFFLHTWGTVLPRGFAYVDFHSTHMDTAVDYLAAAYPESMGQGVLTIRTWPRYQFPH